MAYPRKTTEFMHAAFAREETKCIEWPFATSDGYGKAHDKNGVYSPHRRICEWMHGAAPSETHHAAHLCGNRLCINKRHIVWATPIENVGDHRRMHGRIPEVQPKRRLLSVRDIHQIRSQAADGTSATQIARDYSVTLQAIRKIIARQTYRDVA